MKRLFILLTILILSSTCAFAIQANNTAAMLQYNQGIDYYKIGQYDDAIASFRRAISLNPDYIDAYYNLGALLEYLQQYDAALAVFKQVIVRKPDDYDCVYKAAWLSYKLGDTQKAKTYLSIIPANSPRGKDAQALANEMNFALVQKKEPVQPAQAIQPQPIQGQEQKSGIYQNLAAPTGITTDKDGNVFIAEFNTNSIIKITPEGKKIVFLKDTKINGPIGIAYDKSKNMYIANYNRNNVLKISPLGDISILISNLKKPYYLYIDGNMLYVSCQGSGSVLRYKLSN